jgi:AraC-like DNA-binding protein
VGKATEPGNAWHAAILKSMMELFDTAHDTVFFIKDRGARYVAVSQTLAERCGCARSADLAGKTARDVFPKPMGQAYYEQDQRVLKTGLPLRDELELHLYVRGQPGWCVTNKVPLRDAGGAVVGLLGLSQDLRVSAERPGGYADVAAAARHIRSHFGEALRVEALARMSSLSVFQFEQRIKRVFGVTPAQFIAKTRIDAACDRLRTTRAPVVDIAIDCGFYDQSAFSRQFKAVTGLKPTEFRAQFREAPPADAAADGTGFRRDKAAREPSQPGTPGAAGDGKPRGAFGFRRHRPEKG